MLSAFRRCVAIKDENFWKDRYKDTWSEAADKEEKIKTIVEGECKCRIEYVGLGAGSTDYLSGSAKSRGFKKGGSDLHVADTNIFIEVTGPNIEKIGEEADLWIRPDKIKYAITHSENDHWVVHVLRQNFYVRAVHITEDFKEDFRKGRFKIVHPIIRGTEETYVAVPASSKYVNEIESLFQAINRATTTNKMD